MTYKWCEPDEEPPFSANTETFTEHLRRLGRRADLRPTQHPAPPGFLPQKVTPWERDREQSAPIQRRPAWTYRDREYIRRTLWQRVTRSEGCASRLVWAFVAVLVAVGALWVLCAVLAARGGAS